MISRKRFLWCFTNTGKFVSERLGAKLDFQEIIYQIKQRFLGEKTLKVILTGCLVIFIVITLLIVMAIILAFNYHTQIYDGLLKIFNFIFNDSPDNILSNLLKQIVDNFTKNLFKGD